jgi:hypothetical protein
MKSLCVDFPSAALALESAGGGHPIGDASPRGKPPAPRLQPIGGAAPM